MTEQITTKGTTTPHVASAASPAPSDVAQRWLSALRQNSADELRNLYEVGAAVHTSDDVVLGQERIATALLARPNPPDTDAVITAGRQGMVTLTWGGDDVDRAQSTRLRVRRGKIVEQWIGEQRSESGRLAAVPMNMSTAGDVSAEEHDLVWDTIDGLVSLRDEPVTHVEVRLTQQAGTSRVDPVSLRVIIGLTGGSVRASARAGDVRTAATIVERRLKEGLRRRAERRVDTRSAEQTIRDTEQTLPERWSQRPRSEREIVRNKTVSPGPSTLEEATFDLTTMGYDFFLYVDIETGNDALVARADDGDFVAHTAAPVASLASARNRLDAGNEPFVFFSDQQSRRGNVLYRRFDGHYGLIVPADD